MNLDSAAYEYGLKQCVSSTKVLGTALAGLGLGLGGLQIVNGIKNAAAAALKASSDFEQAGVQFGVMLGDAKKAQRLVNEIQDMANVTPFETQDLLDASKTLLNFGINLRDIMPDLQMLGNIAGGDRQRMQSLTLAFAQMSSAGRLMGQDLLQMINAGFNPLQVISEKTGKSMAVLKDEMSKGQISVEMVRQAFIDATSEGGRFYGMMDKQSETLQGRLSTLNDAYTIMTRSISDMAVPALKRSVEEMTKVVNSTTSAIERFKTWSAENRILVGSIQDAAIALAVLAAAIPVTNIAVVGLIRTIRNFGVITAQTSAYQIAFATLLKGDAALAMIQYRAAITATIIKIRALTAALLQCPLTWVALVLGGAALAWWKYRQAAMETTRAIEELNNAQDEQVNKTTDAIRTLKELGDAKNLDYNQTKRLDAAIQYLTEKYPKYIGRLREELRLKGQISRATAEQIANEMTLAKVKELAERKEKIDKKVENSIKGYKQQQIMAAARFGTPIQTGDTGRLGASRQLQRDQDAINKELENAKKEREAIINELTALEKESEKIDFKAGAAVDSKAAKKAAQEEKKRQKEALDLKIALLEQQKYLTERTEEEIYQIELKQAEARLAAAKKGTAEYAQALAQKMKLEQDHAKRVRELQLESTVMQNDIEREKINHQITMLSMYESAYQISKKQQLQGEIALLQRKIQLEKDSLEQQLKLMGRNETEKVKLRRESVKEQERLTDELTRKNIELKNYEFEKIKGFYDGMTSGFSSSVSSMIKGEKSFADACNDLLDSLTDNFIDQVTKMTSEWIIQKVRQVAFNKIVAASTTSTNAAIVASNTAVAASNTQTAGAAGFLATVYQMLTGTNAAYAASAASTAAATTASATATTAATGTLAGGVTALITPITTLTASMGMLALSSSAVAANMAIIALSTGLYSVEAILANISTLLLNASFGMLAVTSKLAAKGVASLAIANAANSAAAIPVIGWTIAPGAALSTGASIMAADALVQFREKGGPVEAGKAYIVGEKRPELFIPDRDGTILPDTSAMNNGGGDTIYQNSISVSMPITATDAKSFESRIDEFTNRIHKNLQKQIVSRKLAPLG